MAFKGTFANSNRNGSPLFVSVTAGAGMDSDGWRMTPHGRIDLSRAVLDAFTERSGSLLDLTFPEQTIDSSAIGLGVNASTAILFEGGSFMSVVSAGYLLDLDPTGEALVF